MSRNDRSNSNPGSNDDDERNPFVAFRRFADDQIDTAFKGLGNISSVFGDVLKTFDEAEREGRMTWKKFEDHYERAMNPERRRLEGKDDVQAAKSEDGQSQGLRARFRKVQEAVAAERSRSRLDSDVVAAEKAEQELSNQLFGLHPYSPKVLDSEDVTGQSNKNWRIAFEDLMRAQSGVALTDSTRQKAIQQANYDEWSTSLRRQRLGADDFFTADGPWSHGVMWRACHDSRLVGLVVDEFEKAFGRKYGMKQERVDGDEAETELDMYEQFLGRQARSASSTPPAASSSDLGSSSSSHIQTGQKLAEHPKSEATPSVVATLTTTERHMQSDGTVTTKTVLKKRFSDGTEHSEESTNTAQVPIHELKWPDASAWLVGSHRSQQVHDQQATSMTTAIAGEKGEKSKKKEGSWFWSS